ncbi:MAG: DUF5668 domain-containing protein [Candidatus Marinimicrobia bacterium]|jgi:hypothetical protein|nr:DUF5668 domain-containing protein [Candidatus Neomarinimicrobiota bacterium]MCK9483545.1 DUF5668 domain-containing protein [Candidatus Neomarinimicrobiota bacterium]MCK9559879.1 DUF5668 domain-containing protein [Candidatus Neomarinimicrobiota bacterium]MDD5062454.1 DUF5668 domain-containing protein [Candidatus Neomarinimicrobiota bacterium]MDD5540812.1 DUF5668 domain-containing protein [Candidatus Neomarinimicrobiota bacterium]
MDTQSPRSNWIAGLFLVLLGLLILLVQFDFFNWTDFWPLIIIGIGILFLVGFFANRTNFGLLMPAMILLIVGTLFLYMERTTWHNMNHLWPTFVLAPGVGFFFMYFFGPQNNRLWIPGTVLITIAALFFAGEWSIFRYWPVILILLGIYLIFSRKTQS